MLLLTTVNDTLPPPNEPFRLYRFMIPASHEINDIGFAGMLMTISTPIVAQIQALWLTAYLEGSLDVKESSADMKSEAVLHSQFLKWRYPSSFASSYPSFAFDTLSYFDLLLADLGLRSSRKAGMFSEWFNPYGPEDYRGLVDEWQMKDKQGT